MLRDVLFTLGYILAALGVACEVAWLLGLGAIIVVALVAEELWELQS